MTQNNGLILIADDSDDEWTLIQMAFKDAELKNPIMRLVDGVELLEFLGDEARPLPELVVLDLNMPRLSGLETLLQIRKSPRCSTLPVIIMTTSNAEIDVYRSYLNGANAFVIKPLTFEGLIKAFQEMGRFWIRTAALNSQPQPQPQP